MKPISKIIDYIDLHGRDSIFNKLEAFVYVIKCVEVCAVGPRLEDILAKLVCLDLLPELGLQLEINFSNVYFIVRRRIQDQVEATEFNLGSQGLPSIQNVEYKLWDGASREPLELPTFQEPESGLVGACRRNALTVSIEEGL
jgi:hypothetical protein